MCVIVLRVCRAVPCRAGPGLDKVTGGLVCSRILNHLTIIGLIGNPMVVSHFNWNMMQTDGLYLYRMGFGHC